MEWIIGVLVVVVILVVGAILGRSRRPPPPGRGAGSGESVGGIDLPTWVAMDDNVNDD